MLEHKKKPHLAVVARTLRQVALAAWVLQSYSKSLTDSSIDFQYYVELCGFFLWMQEIYLNREDVTSSAVKLIHQYTRFYLTNRAHHSPIKLWKLNVHP